MTRVSFVLALVTATVTGVFNVHPAVQALFYLSLLDIGSGLLKGFITSTLSSDASIKGMSKKVFMFLMVATAYIAESLTGIALPINLHVAVAGFYCTT